MIQKTNQTLNKFLLERQRLKDSQEGITRIINFDEGIVIEWN